MPRRNHKARRRRIRPVSEPETYQPSYEALAFRLVSAGKASASVLERPWRNTTHQTSALTWRDRTERDQ